jgi:predicted helicase
MWTPVEQEAQAAALARERSLGEERPRGIVHTPVEIARFVVRSIDRVLVERFGFFSGIADPRVVVLDPCVGPGIFLAALFAYAGRRPTHPGLVIGCDRDGEAIARAKSTLDREFERGGWPLALEEGDAFELLGAVDEARSPMLARLLSAPPRRRARTDDVGPTPHPLPERRPKRRVDLASDSVMVVLGNPPWSSKTDNAGPAIDRLLDDFRRDALGAPLGERKIGVLSDDYVRFFRLGAELVRRSDRGGVLGLCTNASFLDGPVHRGMRAALLRWFDGIEIVDLGGSALVSRAHDRDDNVFGVRPPVALSILHRTGRLEQRRFDRVSYARVLGAKREKLDALDGDLAQQSIGALAPAYVFVPRREVPVDYGRWVALDEAIPFHREGVQTNRDDLATAATREELVERLQAFVDRKLEGAIEKKLPHYDPERAREVLARDPLSWPIRRLAYRPFETRWLAAVAPLCHRPRPDLIAAVDRSRFVLYSVRKDRGALAWSHGAGGADVPDSSFLSARSSCRTRAFPDRDPDGRENLHPRVKDAWSERLGVELDAVLFLHYALAVLSSESYRHAFDAELRSSYPRIPAPPDAAAFGEAAALGASIAEALALPAEGGPEVRVGHHAVRSERLASALKASELQLSRWVVGRGLR